MKRISIICSFLFLATAISAQSITTGSITYNKAQEQGIIAEYNFTEDLVKSALVNEIEKAGVKGRSAKGFTLFKAVQITQISPDIIDLYIKTERKSKKEKDKAIVYMLISKGYDNFIQPTVDAPVFDNAKNYLSSITSSIAANDLNSQVAEQEEVVKKENKKLEDYEDDMNGLEKKIKKLTADMEDKKKDIENQKAEVNKQQLVLDTLKAKKI